MKKVGSKVRRALLSYLEVREVYELANMDEMSPELQKQMKDGKKILDNLNQYKYSPKTKDEMLEMYKFILDLDEDKSKSEDQDKNKENVDNSNNNDNNNNNNNNNVNIEGSVKDSSNDIEEDKKKKKRKKKDKDLDKVEVKEEGNVK